MAFCFKRKEPVAKALRRLGRERIESALECLKDCRRAEAIHGARKDIKKARAVLRVVRRRMARKEFRQLSKLLRKAASQLADPRDAYVKAKTLKNLARHFHRSLTSDPFRPLHAQLKQDFDDEMDRFTKEGNKQSAKRILHRAAKDLKRLEICGKGWTAIGPGVKSTYAKGLHAYHEAWNAASPEALHEWRKHVKDLWYQVSLLHPVWPEQMEAMAQQLEALGENLGDDHDLFVLQQSLRKQGASGHERLESSKIHGLIEQRQRELRDAAFALGKRFYAEKPFVFCQRLARYWHVWRRGKDPRARFENA